jgi:hypothetical protein
MKSFSPFAFFTTWIPIAAMNPEIDKYMAMLMRHIGLKTTSMTT